MALERVLHSRADRFGLWFAPNDLLSPAHDSEPFYGRYWDSGREGTATEWTSFSSQSPVPNALALGTAPVAEQLDASRSEFLAGPTAGMRRALWVPVLADSHLCAALFVASRNAAAQFPMQDIERAAAELSLVLGYRAVTAAAQSQASDLAAARQILPKICSAQPLHLILQEIANHSFGVISKRKHPGQFALLGVLPAPNATLVIGDLPLDFSFSAGDTLAIRSAMSDSTSEIWRQALHTRSVVGRESQDSVIPGQSIRTFALPLLVANEPVGVLVVGMLSRSASFARLVRLELFASLAASALALSAQKQAARTGDIARFFLQNSSEPVFLLAPDLEIISASPSAADVLTHARPPARPKESAHSATTSASRAALSPLFRPADWRRVSDWLQRVAESSLSDKTHTISAELHTGHSAQMSALPFAPAGLLLIVQEAHTRHQSPSARDALELHNLIEWIDQGVLVFDEHESLRAANQRFSQLLGLSQAELRGAAGLRELVELIAPRVSDPPGFAEKWWDATRAVEASVPEELRVLQPAPRLIERVSRPLRNSSGLLLGRIEIYTDLTPRQLSHAKLHKMERLAALGQNVSGVAHELSNPLTTILGYAERLLRNAGDNHRRGEVQRIFSEADRAVSILRQLLASARESPAPRHPVDLNPVILRTVELDRFQLASEKIHLQLDLAPSLPPALADAGQLQQILMNLISNSRHALLEQKRPGTISVRTFLAQSSRVAIEVSDTGPGIPEAHRHHIFDPFFTTKPAGIGTGLGLSIVMGLVRQNDGNIRMLSPPGKGATFLIEFPAVKVDVPLHVPELPAAQSVFPPQAVSGRVLVVEDEPTVAQLISDMLADLGFAADVLHDARRALISALNREYILIICDMKMPDLDGQHFYRALAEAGGPLTPRFLFVTGDVLGLSTQEFLRKHRLPFVAKPFRLEEFSEKLAVVLNSAHAPSAPSAVLATDLSSKNLLSHG